jgi:hypothetical protein
MDSGAGDRGTSGYRWKRQEFIRPKSDDMDWIWKVFGFVISVGS